MQSRNPWFLAVVVVLTALSVFLYSTTKYKLGLDVEGGARLIYQMDLSELPKDQRDRVSEMQSRTQKVLENRVAKGMGVNEATVVSRGTDQLIVELPAVKDIEEARKFLSTTAKIQAYHAKNVSTELRNKRFQVYNKDDEKGGEPVVTFVRASNPDKVLKPGDPDYDEMIKGWDLILEGEDVSRAFVQVTAGKYQPHFEFSDTKDSDGRSGQDKMGAFSRRYAPEQENLAFVLDGVVLSIAPLEKTAVNLRESAFINGDFDPAYVNKLTELINSGSLPVKLKELAYEQVDPTIGKTALHDMIIAGAVSLGVICLYLIFYYSFPGVVAAVAMLLYTLFTLTVLKMMGATFSLAAIAGFVLSAGMAVDANILVFERVKEEIKAGRKTMTAMEIGFKRALTAIVDSNVSTIMTSLVLWTLGTGAVKGFATTLIIGVAISFFTAVTVTRSLLVGITSLGYFQEHKWYALNRNLFGEHLGSADPDKMWRVISKGKRYFLISGALVLVGWIFVAMGGIKPNVEFQGGSEASFVVGNANVTAETVRKGLEDAGLKGSNVKFATVGAVKSLYVTLPEQATLPKDTNAAKEAIAKAAGVTTENSSYRAVGPTIRDETLTNAVLGIVISSALIVFYLAIRFGVALGGFKNGVKFGLSAVSALLHDVLFIIGMSGLVGFVLGWEVSALFITAMLTVIGFSVHDTIIIFDRIRENLKKARAGESFEELCDKSINQTFARSVNTSMTAIVVLAVLLFFGTPTPELKFMVLTMLLGIMVGTYSSIFNAAPILFLWNRAVIKAKGEAAGLMAEAVRENKLRASASLAVASGAAGSEPAASDAGYGTIKRKRSVKEQATVELDEDE